jgi:hypothetical protein
MVRFGLASLLILCLAAGSSFGQGKHGTAAEAEAMVKKAVTYLKTNGEEKSLKDFSDPAGKFVEGDLYIFVYDLQGKCVAHGGNPKMVGKELLELKDADGKEFVKERIEIAKSKGKGWQNYKWNNPTTKKIEDKTAYIEKTGNFIIGCGAYK